MFSKICFSLYIVYFLSSYTFVIIREKWNSWNELSNFFNNCKGSITLVMNFFIKDNKNNELILLFFFTPFNHHINNFLQILWRLFNRRIFFNVYSFIRRPNLTAVRFIQFRHQIAYSICRFYRSLGFTITVLVLIAFVRIRSYFS